MGVEEWLILGAFNFLKHQNSDIKHFLRVNQLHQPNRKSLGSSKAPRFSALTHIKHKSSNY